MACCLCLTETEDGQDVQCDKSDISSILRKYFHFCFSDNLIEGIVCHKCLCQVQLFHEFFIRIETLHCATQTNESIFVDAATGDSNISLLVKEEDDVYRATDLLNESFDVSLPSATVTEIRSIKRKVEPIDAFEVVRPKKTSYKTNYRSRGKNSSNIFHCDTCSLTFLSEYKMYCHTKETHQQLPFKCAEAKCVESYGTQEQLSHHVTQNHSRVNCPHCQKSIKMYYLPLHIKFYHDKDQRVVCDLCGNVSDNMNKHKSHHRLVHDIQPRLQCDICKDWSRNKNSLREHMRVRHIQVPEMCSICGKISANKKALMKHKKFHFAEAREKFKCDVCGHGFRDSTKLKEHSYIHSGISDVYRCSYCDKSFRFASSMYAHRKKAHPNDQMILRGSGHVSSNTNV